jgi:hypothetical protein
VLLTLLAMLLLQWLGGRPPHLNWLGARQTRVSSL